MNQSKMPSPTEGLIVSLGIVISFHFISFILIFIFQTKFTQYSTEDFSRILFIVGGVYYLICLFIYLRSRNLDSSITLRLKKIPLDVVFWSALIGASAGILGDEINILRQKIIPDPEWFSEITRYFSASGTMDWILLITGVVLLASFSEEFIFRGLLQNALEKSGDITRAVMLASLAWTIVHLNIYWAIQTFITGVILGFVVWRSGSVLPAVVAHGINNFLALLFYNFGANLTWYKMGDHISPVVLIAAAAVLWWSIRQFSLKYGILAENSYTRE